MAVSKAFRGLILGKARKGTRYNRQANRIEYDLRLSSNEIDWLIDIGLRQYGFDNRIGLKREIESVIREGDRFADRVTLPSVNIGDLRAGDILNITYGHDSSLLLLAVRRGVLLCVCDNNNDLLYGDVVQPLSYSIEHGAPLYLRVVRSGMTFPRESCCYSIDTVDGISLLRNEKSQPEDLPVTCDIENVNGDALVYAENVDTRRNVFPLSSLVYDNIRAVYTLDLGKMTYTLNEAFDKEKYRDMALTELNRACRVASRIDNLYRVEVVNPGRIRYLESGPYRCFEIVAPLELQMV